MTSNIDNRHTIISLVWKLHIYSIHNSTDTVVSSCARVHKALDVLQGICMLVGFLCAAVNSLVIAPLIVRNMVAAFSMEVAAGLGDVIGYADMSEMKKTNPAYSACYKKFRRCHGLSALLTVLSLVANTVQLYYLASRCVPLWCLQITQPGDNCANDKCDIAWYSCFHTSERESETETCNSLSINTSACYDCFLRHTRGQTRILCLKTGSHQSESNQWHRFVWRMNSTFLCMKALYINKLYLYLWWCLDEIDTSIKSRNKHCDD